MTPKSHVKQNESELLMFIWVCAIKWSFVRILFHSITVFANNILRCTSTQRKVIDSRMNWCWQNTFEWCEICILWFWKKSVHSVTTHNTFWMMRKYSIFYLQGKINSMDCWRMLEPQIDWINNNYDATKAHRSYLFIGLAITY